METIGQPPLAATMTRVSGACAAARSSCCCRCRFRRFRYRHYRHYRFRCCCRYRCCRCCYHCRFDGVDDVAGDGAVDGDDGRKTASEKETKRRKRTMSAESCCRVRCVMMKQMRKTASWSQSPPRRRTYRCRCCWSRKSPTRRRSRAWPRRVPCCTMWPCRAWRESCRATTTVASRACRRAAWRSDCRVRSAAVRWPSSSTGAWCDESEMAWVLGQHFRRFRRNLATRGLVAMARARACQSRTTTAGTPKEPTRAR